MGARSPPTLALLPALESLSLLLSCLVQPVYEGFSLVLVYLVLSPLTFDCWRPALFAKSR